MVMLDDQSEVRVRADAAYVVFYRLYDKHKYYHTLVTQNYRVIPLICTEITGQKNSSLQYKICGQVQNAELLLICYDIDVKSKRPRVT